MSQADAFSNLLREGPRFPPSTTFSSTANVDRSDHEEAGIDWLKFWDVRARRLSWATPWERTLDWTNPPFARWFVGGTLNAAVLHTN